MGNTSYSCIINIKEEYREGGVWSLTSPDLPGLFLAGRELSVLRNDIPKAIQVLFKRNYDMDVEVRLLVDATEMSKKVDRPIEKPTRWTAFPYIPAERVAAA